MDLPTFTKKRHLDQGAIDAPQPSKQKRKAPSNYSEKSQIRRAERAESIKRWAEAEAQYGPLQHGRGKLLPGYTRR